MYIQWNNHLVQSIYLKILYCPRFGGKWVCISASVGDISVSWSGAVGSWSSRLGSWHDTFSLGRGGDREAGDGLPEQHENQLRDMDDEHHQAGGGGLDWRHWARDWYGQLLLHLHSSINQQVAIYIIRINPTLHGGLHVLVSGAFQSYLRDPKCWHNSYIIFRNIFMKKKFQIFFNQNPKLVHKSLKVPLHHKVYFNIVTSE